MNFLKPDDSPNVNRFEEKIEEDIKTYIEKSGFQLEDLLIQSRIPIIELQTLEGIGGLEILLSIYSARGMDFGIYLFIIYLYV